MPVSLEMVYSAVQESRQETRAGFEALNGRVRECEEQGAVNKTNITNLQEQVKTLAIVDKVAAFVFAAASGIAAAVFGK